MKPILFNTDMVQAIQEDRKTVTRRVIKPRYADSVFEWFKGEFCEASPYQAPEQLEGGVTRHFVRRYVPCEPPYHPGDILWVRETWQIQAYRRFEAVTDIRITYKAGGTPTHIQFDKKSEYDFFVAKWSTDDWRWRPSIHMPKEAARLFLRVTGVRVERLQEMDADDAAREGVPDSAEGQFATLWDSTIKSSDLPLYGWEANPWVWVIEFERCERPAGWPKADVVIM